MVLHIGAAQSGVFVLLAVWFFFLEWLESEEGFFLSLHWKLIRGIGAEEETEGPNFQVLFSNVLVRLWF